jgi:hypothetical protein
MIPGKGLTPPLILQRVNLETVFCRCCCTRGNADADADAPAGAITECDKAFDVVDEHDGNEDDDEDDDNDDDDEDDDNDDDDAEDTMGLPLVSCTHFNSVTRDMACFKIRKMHKVISPMSTACNMVDGV